MLLRIATEDMKAFRPELQLALTIGVSSEELNRWKLVDAIDEAPTRLKHTVAIRAGTMERDERRRERAARNRSGTRVSRSTLYGCIRACSVLKNP